MHTNVINHDICQEGNVHSRADSRRPCDLQVRAGFSKEVMFECHLQGEELGRQTGKVTCLSSEATALCWAWVVGRSLGLILRAIVKY